MKLRLALVLALALPGAAVADLASDYRSAVATFGNPALSGTEAELGAVKAQLQRLPGTYVLVSNAETGTGDLDLQVHADLCAKSPARVELKGDYSFDLIRSGSSGDLAFQHRYAGSGQFLRYVDEKAYFDWLGFDAARRQSMPALLSLSTQSVMARLFVVSDDLFILMPERGRQEYWARCP